MYTVLVASLFIIAIIMGLSIYCTHKAYTRKWEDEQQFLDFDNQQKVEGNQKAEERHD